MHQCPNCKSFRVQSRGNNIYCHDCKKYARTPAIKAFKSVERGGGYLKIVCASDRIRSQEDAIREFGIDLDVWHVEKCKIKTSEGYRKDREVEWNVDDGKVTRGRVKDSGKLLIAPMYHIELLLIKKVEEYNAKESITRILEKASRKAPHVALRFRPLKNGLRYEVDFPDLHFGKLTWDKESGANYDIQIAKQVIDDAVETLISRIRGQKIGRIILPIGNDYFNVDNKKEETSHGTPQQEDTRWQKTYEAGADLAIGLILSLSSIAPVDVLVVPGNHDEERSFFLGHALSLRFFNDKNVMVNNEPPKRKYYTFGKVLIGFTHGYHEKPEKLPFLMPIERPDDWARTIYREWHLGDKHHKKDLLYRTEDTNGVTMRYLRSLSATDTWHFDKGYVGSPRAAEAFLWHPDDGLIAQYHYTKKES